MISQCELLKQKGKDLFKQSRYQQALEAFTKAADMLRPQIKTSSESLKLFLMCLTNASAAATNIQNYSKAIQLCSNALEYDPSNSKALYRRACSLKELGEQKEKQTQKNLEEIMLLYGRARDDFTKLFQSVDNKEARAKWNEVKQNIARVKILQKSQQPRPAPKMRSNQPQPQNKPKVSHSGPNPTQKKLLEYNVSTACSMIQDRMQKELFEGKLPQFKSDLERNFKLLEKKPDMLHRYITRMTPAYLQKMQPDIDMLYNIVQNLADPRRQPGPCLPIYQTLPQLTNFKALSKMLAGSLRKRVQGQLVGWEKGELAGLYDRAS